MADKRTPSGMFLTLGGDIRTLEAAREYALAEFAKWLAPKVARGDIVATQDVLDELSRYVGRLVHTACANVGVEGLQAVINRSAIESSHSDPTLLVPYAVCPKCGARGGL